MTSATGWYIMEEMCVRQGQNLTAISAALRISVRKKCSEWGRTLFAKVYVPIRISGCPFLHLPLSPFAKVYVPKERRLTKMKYDFTSIIDRQGKDALAVDGVGENPGFAPDKPKEGFDVIPMWVADMNFATVPTVPEEVIKRANHALFGYFNPCEEYFQSIIE